MAPNLEQEQLADKILKWLDQGAHPIGEDTVYVLASMIADRDAALKVKS